MRYVISVAQHQLQRVLAGFELDRGLRLAFAIMQMLRVGRHRLIRIGQCA